jgi:tRNA threonylcarbamoyladenosine biosynthesis protein TsaE
MSDIGAMTTELMETVCHSRSPEETIDFARSIAQKYPQGACFYLEGELGAGKTLFAKGIASTYGVDPTQVVSPTFALVNRYSEGALPVYHIDLYRIETERELIELGLEDIEDERATMIVEWPEKLGRYRRTDAVIVRLEVLDEESREIRIEEPETNQ